jgi:mannosyl-3-phosphoglycerate phosphatase
MKVIFTDLDGTLLDAETYSFEAARPALEMLATRGIPLVFCTSKTRAEVEVLRDQLKNRHPFIVENGGGAFIPQGYFPFQVPGSSGRGGYDVVEFGDPYEDLVSTLGEASEASDVVTLGFHQMTTAAVAASCGLTLEQARLARQREYDEPFEILDTRTELLLREIELRGKRWTHGGRFFHITGNNDKAEAVRRLTGLYKRLRDPVVTIGLGDGLNDAGFLSVVDLPILVRSPQAVELQLRVPHGRLTHLSGPAGWNQAVLEVAPE